MSAPVLNRQLVLEAPVRAPDGAGGFAETWSVLGALWAEVTARTGRERSGSGATVSAVTYRIAVRGAPVGSMARPVAGQRFREGTRIFAIRAVAERGHDGRYLECTAEEESAT